MPNPSHKPKRRPLLDVRTTVSFEQEIYSALEDISYEKRVSIGCIVREAVAIYVQGYAQLPQQSGGRGRR
jgi:hypothetical protein